MVMICPTNRPFAIMSAPENTASDCHHGIGKAAFRPWCHAWPLSALSPRQMVS